MPEDARALVAREVRNSAPEVDLRMALQGAHFTIHGSRQPLEEDSDAQEFLRLLVIPEDAVATLREELAILGVRRSVLFPDLEHLAQELEESGADGATAG